MSDVSLVVFTCNGKKHLLKKCITSFENKCRYNFDERIVCLDGDVKEEALSLRYDKVVKNKRRRGYVESIRNGVGIVKSEYFFWLEDDWLFSRKVNIEFMIEKMKQEWCQIILDKRRSEAKSINNTGVIDSSFSANPCLCRTELIHKGIVSIQRKSEVGQIPFEHSMNDWLKEKGYECKRLTCQHQPLVDHIGDIESTERKWHAPDASAEPSTFQIARSQGENISFKNRVSMMIKITYVLITLITKQLWDDEAYSLSFRIQQAFRNRI